MALFARMQKLPFPSARLRRALPAPKGTRYWGSALEAGCWWITLVYDGGQYDGYYVAGTTGVVVGPEGTAWTLFNPPSGTNHERTTEVYDRARSQILTELYAEHTLTLREVPARHRELIGIFMAESGS
jgi:hypothetical protein